MLITNPSHFWVPYPIDLFNLQYPDHSDVERDYARLQKSKNRRKGEKFSDIKKAFQEICTRDGDLLSNKMDPKTRGLASKTLELIQEVARTFKLNPSKLKQRYITVQSYAKEVHQLCMDDESLETINSRIERWCREDQLSSKKIRSLLRIGCPLYQSLKFQLSQEYIDWFDKTYV